MTRDPREAYRNAASNLLAFGHEAAPEAPQAEAPARPARRSLLGLIAASRAPVPVQTTTDPRGLRHMLVGGWWTEPPKDGHVWHDVTDDNGELTEAASECVECSSRFEAWQRGDLAAWTNDEG